VAALGLFIAGRAMEPHTRVEVVSDGGQVRLTAAGSSVAAPMSIDSVQRISIHAMDSVFPPGGRSLTVTQGKYTVFVDRLPSRFRLPRGRIMPLGDWELDEMAGDGVVFTRDLDLRGPFELSATFTGRVHHHLTIIFHGTPGAAISFRRGLINNDLFIEDGERATVAATSIDPAPLTDLLAAASIVTHTAAAAALLIAMFIFVDRLPFPGRGRRRTRSAGTGRFTWVAATALAGTAAGLSVWVASEVLQRLPHFPDSVVYLLQAKWLLAGRLFLEVAPIQDHLTVPFTYVVDGRWVAHYPFGWPLLLAVGQVLGHPWMVAPLLAAAYTLLLYLVGKELFTPPVGLTAVVLAVVSPISCLVFASMLSHAASSTLVLLFLWLMLKARRTGATWPALVAGLALGLAFGIRPLTALAIAVPCAVFLLIELAGTTAERAVRVAGATVLGGLLGTAPTLVANQIVTGSPVAFPYTLARGTMYSGENIAFGIRNLDAILASTVPALYGWGWGFAWGWLFLALPLAFALVPFLLRRHARHDLLLGWCFLAVVVAHLGAQGHGLHGFGPRYYFDAFFALYLLTARGFQELSRIGVVPDEAAVVVRPSRAAPLLAAALFVILNGTAAAVLPQRLTLYRGYNRINGSMVRQLETSGIDRALILFAVPNWRDWARASPKLAADLQGDLVFAQELDDNRGLFEHFPDRPVYVWLDQRLEPIEKR
jgi:hypothetical protein